MDKYFYKGFEILEQDGKFLVLSPSLRFQAVHSADSKVNAKLWIETEPTRAVMLRGADALK